MECSPWLILFYGFWLGWIVSIVFYHIIKPRRITEKMLKRKAKKHANKIKDRTHWANLEERPSMTPRF